MCMSKKKESVDAPPSIPMDGRIIYDYQIQSLEGKILTFLESLGLPSKQEEAVKEMFRDIYYRQMYFETDYVYGEYLQDAIANSRRDAGVKDYERVSGRIGSSH